MIDIHSHVLHTVDDGPKTLEESLDIMMNAVAEGITDMIATPHAHSPQYDVSAEKATQQLKTLSQLLITEKIPLTLHAGQEIRLHETIVENLKNGSLLTLAGSPYVLVELPSQTVPSYTVRIIEQLVAEGLLPIIAHPERNRAIAEKPERLQRLIRHGAAAQITAGSVSGHFGKGIQDLSFRLLEANCIQTYGSDVHNMQTRPLEFKKGLDLLEKKKFGGVVDILLENNARILENRPLVQLEMGEIQKKRWWKMGVKI